MYFKTVTLLTTCLYSAFVLALGVSRDDDASLLVETSLGRLRGINKRTSTGKTVRVFYKVPFAEPPVGELRFKPPEPVKPWPGVLDCTKIGAPCMQKQMPLIKLLPALNNLLGLGPQEPSEDCLFLHIFVPQIGFSLGISVRCTEDSVIRMGTDSGFLCPSFQLENALLKANRTVYKYRFKHAPKIDGLHVPDWIGALHSSELLSLFGHPIKSGVSDDVVMLSRTVMRYWANFARTGNPSISPNNDLNLSTWAPMSKDRGNYQILDINATATGYFDGRRCKFWNHLFPKLYRNENQNTPSEGPFLKLTDEEIT